MATVRSGSSAASDARSSCRRSWLAVFFVGVGVVACNGDDPRHAVVVEPVSGNACQREDCSGHGSCVESSEHEAVCLCREGYVGASCNACAAGFHAILGGRCVADRRCQDEDVDPCGVHGVCTDERGVIGCECDSGYEGARCELCASGYQRSEHGECLQLIIRGEDVGPVPSECSEASCGGHGRCTEDEDTFECTCFPGYVGGDCDLCDRGYHRVDDDCVVDATCDAMDCGSCAGFEEIPSFAEKPDTCVSHGRLDLADLSLESLDGSGTVWLCGASTKYGLGSKHVLLEVDESLPGHLTFERPIVRLQFELGALDAMSLELLAEGDVLESIDADRNSHETVILELDGPIRELTLRTSEPAQVAIDDLEYEFASCP